MEELTLAEKLDIAMKKLFATSDKLIELDKKVEYAGNLLKLNQIKQKQVQELLGVNNDN